MKRVLGALVLLAAAVAADAATVLERRVDVRVNGAELTEDLRLRIRLENADDVAAWGVYRVALDEHRTLQHLAVRAVLPSGEVVDGGERDRVERSAPSVLHTSRYFEVVRLRGLVPGTVVEVEETVRSRPYYPASKVLLRGDAATEDVEVRLTRADGPLRWHLNVKKDFTIEEDGGGVVVRGRQLPAVRLPELAPTREDVLGVLRFSWGDGVGEDGGWEDVGRWYGELVDGARGDVRPVAAEARAIADSLGERERVEALTRFVQEKIRYVAVLVGEGGYAPSPPTDVLERRWGDCKDKSLLLVEMLRAVGIGAWPALVRSDANGRVDRHLATPEAFNHAVVAIPGETGYDFVDATLSFGGTAWLHPYTQGQDALVIRDEGSRLARTPLNPANEHRSLVVTASVGADGTARGTVRLRLRGELAYRQIGQWRAERRQDFGGVLLAGLLPGAEIGPAGVDESTDGVPELTVEADVVLPNLVQGTASRRSLELPGMRATPDPALLDGRTVDVVLPARSTSAAWRLELPEDWCPAVERQEEVHNGAGIFVQDVRTSDGVLVVARRTELQRRWTKTADLGELAELALAEHRGHRRRVRLRCP